MGALDAHTLLFTESNIELFNVFKDSLDNQTLNEAYPFLERVSKIYNKRLTQLVSIMN
jgi:hypothetical protein